MKKEVKKMVKIRAILALVLVLALTISCQMIPKWVPYESQASEMYPGKQWQKATTPEQLGWSSEKLELARAYSKKIGSAAVMIVDNGVVIDAWGDIKGKYQCHSMRKSLLSALIGVHVGEGRIDLSKTMAELGIDDYEPSLTPKEMQATTGDLIKARSGIYHPALGESAGMKAKRPKRYSHPPAHTGITTTGISMPSVPFSSRKPGQRYSKSSTNVSPYL